MSEAEAKKEGEECCTAGHRARVAHGRSESISDIFASTLDLGALATTPGSWLEAGTEEASQSLRAEIPYSPKPHPWASTISLLPANIPLSVDDGIFGAQDTGFRTPSVAVGRCFEALTREVEEDRQIRSKGLTAPLSVAQSLHNTVNVNLDQIIEEGISEGWRQRTYSPRQDNLFAPGPPDMSKATSQGQELGSPIHWLDSNTEWSAKPPNRDENRQMSQDLHICARPVEMCGCGRVLAASRALNSVVAWDPEDPVLLRREQEGEHEGEDGVSLQARVESWLRSLTK
ncbi:hypothetical protein AYO20_01891 [Fonsecaea nubica]|uniref:Uncharacterized protein n=1 Tax=Fonsecaea nubica TaxID=856822 RepID=A0A178DC43_9EURO|nr:hypothetical protein AYO20_01891 [Fonsecaea nubica]OAL38685.1 hypothetical protein AYO20_01891 [Fonsecaea nubica]